MLQALAARSVPHLAGRLQEARRAQRKSGRSQAARLPAIAKPISAVASEHIDL